MTITARAIKELSQFDPRLGYRLEWLRNRRLGDRNLAIIDMIVRRGDVVVDVGANVGVYTNRFRTLVGRSGHVMAIEPNTELVPRLCRIARRANNINIAAVAVSDMLGVASLRVPVIGGREATGLASLGSSPVAAVEFRELRVPVRTLDSLTASLDRIDFVKIDVEGHELDVLKGGVAVLAKKPTLLVEIEQRHHRDSISRVFDYVQRAGYVGWAVGPTGLLALDEFDVIEHQLKFVSDQFQNRMPRGYTSDFLFMCPENLTRRRGGISARVARRDSGDPLSGIA